MKIAIFSDCFYPELSGISDSIIALAKELAKFGNHINFYVPYYSKANYKLANVLSKEIYLGENIEITRFFSLSIKTGTKQGRMVIPDGLRWIKVKKFNPDIIHTQLFFGVGLEALWVARRLKVPLIGTNHTAIKEFLRYFPLRSVFIDNLIIKYVNWYYSKCALVTAPSKIVLEEMEKSGLIANTKAISNPIDTMTFQPLPKKPAEYDLISAGRLAPERKTKVIIKALPLVKKKFPNVKLALAGRGIEERGLKQLIHKLGLDNNVVFLGFVNQPALNQAYNSSKIFVITSTSETQSLVMMQAMAAGLPVIGVRAMALPEYLDNNHGILVDPDNSDLLAEKIIYLLENREIREKMGQNASVFVQKFSISNIVKEWENIYRNIISLKNRL